MKTVRLALVGSLLVGVGSVFAATPFDMAANTPAGVVKSPDYLAIFAPAAVSANQPLPPAGNFFYLNSLTGSPYDCTAVPLSAAPGYGTVNIFQKDFLTAPASTYLDLQFNGEAFLFPKGITTPGGVGIALDCQVTQDTNGNGVIDPGDTVFLCPGNFSTFSPWLYFFPLDSQGNTTSAQTSYQGILNVTPNLLTRVSINILGQTLHAASTTKAWICGPALKIGY